MVRLLRKKKTFHSKNKLMISDFDILFDNICDDVFPKLDIYIQDNVLVDGNEYVDVHEIKEFLTDIEGYDTDISNKIWDSYLHSRKKLLHSKADATS